MGNRTERLCQHAVANLVPGERALTAVRCSPKGRTKRRMAGIAAGGMVGSLIADAAERSRGRSQQQNRGPVLASGWPAEPSLALVLTDRRLLIYRRSHATDRPTDLIAACSLDTIAGMALGTTRVLIQHFPTIEIRFADGSTVELETQKGDRADRFVEAFTFLAHQRPN